MLVIHEIFQGLWFGVREKGRLGAHGHRRKRYDCVVGVRGVEMRDRMGSGLDSQMQCTIYKLQAVSTLHEREERGECEC